VWLNEREGLVANNVGLPNERRRYVSKEHVWRHGNGKNYSIKYCCIMKTKILNEIKNSDPKDEVLRFCTLMIKLHNCCTISAGIERIFSVFGLICHCIWKQFVTKKSRENSPNLPEPQQKFDLNLYHKIITI
jgi:hypothetical protein